MSGANIAYHLRPNKSIERHLFIELLHKLENGLPQRFSEYSYYGLGGAYMEDFRLIQRHLGVTRMVCLEKNKNALARQKFNKPANCIRFLDIDSSEFVSEYNDSKPAIVWLDYSEPKWEQQLPEIASLARSLAPNSILKFTLVAQPSALGSPPPGGDMDLQEYRLEKLRERLPELVPAAAKVLQMQTRHFPVLLTECAKACMESVFGALSDRIALPLALYSYSDGTPIITITTIVGKKDVVGHSLNKARLKDWPYFSNNWDDLIVVDSPDLTLKERLHIESLLPRKSAAEIGDNLGFKIGEENMNSLAAIKNYIKFHRRLPFFIKVTA
jgi:hypothetical protein